MQLEREQSLRVDRNLVVKPVLVNLLAAICLCFLVSFAVIVFGPEGAVGPERFPGMNFYHALSRHASPFRRIGFLMWCGLLAVIILLFSKTRWRTALSGELGIAKAFLSVVALGIFAVNCFYRRFLYSFLSGLPASFVLWKRPRAFSGKIAAAVFALLSLAAFAAMFYVECFVPPNFFLFDQWASVITDMETHNAYIFGGPADRLAAGYKLCEGMLAPYGVLFQYGLAFWEKSFGILSWGGVIKFIGAVQMLFVCSAALCYIKYAGRRKALGWMAVLMLIPLFPSFDVMTYYPNVSAVRFFGFVVATIYLLLLAPRLPDRFLSLGNGFIGGLALLSNFETGAIISIALFVHAIARRFKLLFPPVSQIFRTLGLFVAGILICFVVFELLVALGFGYFIPLSAWFENTKKMLQFGAAGGTSSGEFEQFVVPIISACQSGYLLVRLFSRERSHSARDAATIAICVMNILWMVYYFNTPHIEAFSTNYFLYLFLFIDLVRSLSSDRFFQQQKWLRLLLLSVAFTVFADIGYRYVATGMALIKQIKNANTGTAGSEIICGIRLSNKLAAELRQRADFVKEEAKKTGKVTYFTNNAVLIPKLSGVQSHMPHNEIYCSLVQYRDNLKLMTGLAASNVSPILIDAPDISLSGTASQKQCIETFRMMLNQNYVLENTTNGWQIWILKSVPNGK